MSFMQTMSVFSEVKMVKGCVILLRVVLYEQEKWSFTFSAAFSRIFDYAQIGLKFRGTFSQTDLQILRLQ